MTERNDSGLNTNSILFKLDSLINEAIASGVNQRSREYSGFDFAIYTQRIEPLLTKAKSLPEYTSDSHFMKQIDERERKCNHKLMGSRRFK